MLLGAIIAGLNDEAAAGEALIAYGDLALLSATQAACLRHGETAGEYVAGAVRRFANLAGDDEWLQLMGALERTPSPAGTCLSTMVRWSIQRDAEADDVSVESKEGHCACGKPHDTSGLAGC